ncbi:hypothetical protein WOLCODRAFT_153949 [Wolfiporia cocos MD-104 SS10]|uniref:Uncharacterized protein n=1 Tax=Wolfiporia cocos (strain MD-104) TaxID=742152 RepID=A0A2H3K1A7_WOLCO|nr:hypothetical protein WOLCODRAFT_153949 [Wolfiporia cocos MD-104 SS10]
MGPRPISGCLSELASAGSLECALPLRGGRPPATTPRGHGHLNAARFQPDVLSWIQKSSCALSFSTQTGGKSRAHAHVPFAGIIHHFCCIPPPRALTSPHSTAPQQRGPCAVCAPTAQQRAARDAAAAARATSAPAPGQYAHRLIGRGTTCTVLYRPRLRPCAVHSTPIPVRPLRGRTEAPTRCTLREHLISLSPTARRSVSLGARHAPTRDSVHIESSTAPRPRLHRIARCHSTARRTSAQNTTPHAPAETEPGAP